MHTDQRCWRSYSPGHAKEIEIVTYPSPKGSAMRQPGGPVLNSIQRGVALVGKVIESLVFLAGSAILVILSVILFAQVVFRYVIEQPLPWAEEAARYFLVWLAMFAAVLAARRGLHFVFRWGTLWMSTQTRSKLKLIINLLVVGILAVILVQSLTYFFLMGNQRTQATNINMQLPVAGIVAGVFLLSVVYLLDSVDQILGIFTKKSTNYVDEEDARAIALLSEEH
jgi:TRAP-type C4-dicarboxylate transport system permease small subunit